MQAPSFKPPKGEYPIFDLLLEAMGRDDQERTLGYISLWYLHAFIKGLVIGSGLAFDDPQLKELVEEEVSNARTTGKYSKNAACVYPFSTQQVTSILDTAKQNNLPFYKPLPIPEEQN